MKVWEYGMIAYFLEIPNPGKPFFQSLTKFQKGMLKFIVQLLSMKMKKLNSPLSYLINWLDDQRQEWFPERQGVVTDPALARAIGFFNIYHVMWESIERGKILVHCGNTTFIYHNDFSKYMKVDGAMSEDVFDYLFDLGARKFLSEKEKKYLHELFEKWDPEHLENDEDFNDRLEDNIGYEGM